MRGAYAPAVPRDGAGRGAVVLRASYRDRGANGLPGAGGKAALVLRAPLRPTAGVHDVFFFFRNEQAPDGRSLVVLTTATFEPATP